MKSQFPNAEKYPLLSHDSQIFPLRDKIGGHRVFMWRDDPDDFGFGGNKVRFFEYLIPEILSARPDLLLTAGSSFSNHIRVTSLVGARLGIPVVLLINEDAPTEGEAERPNVAFSRAAGAEIRYIGAFAAEMRARMTVREFRRAGKDVFFIPAGGHLPGAVRAYADVTVDALTRLSAQGADISRIFLPCASGTTQTGVLAGLTLLGTDKIPDVTAFAVANDPSDAAEEETAFFCRAAQTIPEFSGRSIPAPSVLDCGKNAYGHPDAELLALRASLAASDGVLLDRVYNINAFFGMKQLLERTPGDSDVLYINTGGCLE